MPAQRADWTSSAAEPPLRDLHMLSLGRHRRAGYRWQQLLAASLPSGCRCVRCCMAHARALRCAGSGPCLPFSAQLGCSPDASSLALRFCMADLLQTLWCA